METQIQKSGNNSQQVQVGTLVLGIDEKRVREIFDEKISSSIKELSQEASVIAVERIRKLEDSLIEKIIKLECGLKSFADPSFQFSLIEAQRSAAGTERPEDYELLSELLIHRIKKGKNRGERTGIKKAIEIIGDISDDALLALTVTYIVSYIVPDSGDIAEGLNDLDKLIGVFLDAELPVTENWADHLYLLNLVRIEGASQFMDIRTIYTNRMNGYIEPGIKKDTENFERAIKLIADNGMSPKEILVEHIFNTKYVRLNIVNTEELLKENSPVSNSIRSLNNNQIQALKTVFELYESNSKLKEENISSFMNEWDNRNYLLKLRKWWENLKTSFDLTDAGKVLAEANAKRCFPTFPYF